AALLAARRCAGSPPLRSFWRLMGLAIASQLIADSLLLRNVVAHPLPPFPSAADPFFLAFYALLLLALLRVPVAPVSRSRQVRILLDAATVVVGGGALVWYFLLGPTALEGKEDTLARAVSIAYPIGDLILLAGLAAVLLRRVPEVLRTPLLLIAAGMVCSIVADVIYGYGELHGTYTNGDPVDTLYLFEFALFALAGASQRPVAAGEIGADMSRWRQPTARASWLPYLAAPIGFALLLGVDWSHPFFPELSLVAIALLLSILIGARQYLALRELASAEAALRESEKVKDEFLAIVGHELRTPLTSLRGSLGLLHGGVLGELPAEAVEMLSIAIANTDRLVRLVNDILDVERLSSGRIEIRLAPVPAARLVDDATRVVQASATLAEVELDSETADLTVSADGDRVVQALVNLLGNAIKFSPPGGAITTTVVADGDWALFSVEDHGRGIPAERQESVFERFRQVDASDAREKGGTGLGLPIARGIVEHHGGRMWAQSTPGQGSTFRFTLPLLASRPPAGGEERQPEPGLGARRDPAGREHVADPTHAA
ncbi:MAG TPA: HAMP domain-containing sensor histidine kinase, partial [Solirubrobacteraceae bacterium]|nr:HAMP domain-containing sensor histidine kinase [Solirubrobacteraceae bacterium]